MSADRRYPLPHGFSFELMVWRYLCSSQWDSLSPIIIALFSTTRISDTRALSHPSLSETQPVYLYFTHIFIQYYSFIAPRFHRMDIL